MTLSAALASTALILPAGVAAAWALSRWRGAGRSWVETLLSLPLVLPPTAIGLLLLQLFAARGPLGRLLDGPRHHRESWRLRHRRAPGWKAGHDISARNVFAGEVAAVHEIGADVFLTIDTLGYEWVAKVTAGAIRQLSIQRGSKVFVVVKTHSFRRLR